MQALDKLTQVVDGQSRFVSDPPLLVPIEELLSEEQSTLLTERMHEFLRSYRRTLQSDRGPWSWSDIFPGLDQVEGIDGVPRDFYVRQLIRPFFALPLHGRVTGLHGYVATAAAVTAHDDAPAEFDDAAAPRTTHLHGVETTRLKENPFSNCTSMRWARYSHGLSTVGSRRPAPAAPRPLASPS